jgi:hypothetical protein
MLHVTPRPLHVTQPLAVAGHPCKARDVPSPNVETRGAGNSLEQAIPRVEVPVNAIPFRRAKAISPMCQVWRNHSPFKKKRPVASARPTIFSRAAGDVPLTPGGRPFAASEAIRHASCGGVLAETNDEPQRQSRYAEASANVPVQGRDSEPRWFAVEEARASLDVRTNPHPLDFPERRNSCDESENLVDGSGIGN